MEGPFSNKYAGIFYDPTDFANVWDLQNRQQFLHSAARHVPRFADALLEATVPLILERIKEKGALPTRAAPEYSEFYSQIFAAIRGWAKEFNIEVDWIFDEAWEIVIVAITYAQKGIEVLEAFGTWRRSTHPGTGTRAFVLPAWNPREESPEAYSARANKAWKQSREEYIAATKSELEKAGLEPVPKRRKRQFSEEVRFEWAVLHRCAAMPISELAEKYREDTETVRISVARVLSDVGLELPT